MTRNTAATMKAWTENRPMTWIDGEGDMMTLQMKAGKAYGIGNKFDFERNTIDQAIAQLKKWGYKPA